MSKNKEEKRKENPGRRRIGERVRVRKHVQGTHFFILDVLVDFVHGLLERDDFARGLEAFLVLQVGLYVADVYPRTENVTLHENNRYRATQQRVNSLVVRAEEPDETHVRLLGPLDVHLLPGHLQKTKRTRFLDVQTRRPRTRIQTTPLVRCARTRREGITVGLNVAAAFATYDAWPRGRALHFRPESTDGQ